MKYLVNIKDGEDEKYDMLTNKNSKFLFYHFSDYLKQINEPTKPVCHSVVLNDEIALGILQNKIGNTLKKEFYRSVSRIMVVD